METHAHHLHKAPGKNFWHYFFEFFMLFLAVFCGFLAENFREDAVERRREKQYMRSMIADLKEDTSQYADVITFNTKRMVGLDSMLDKLNDSSLDATVLYYFMGKYVLPARRFDPSQRTLNQLKNAGGMRLIHQQDVSDSINSYDISINGLLSQQEATVNYGRAARDMVWDIFDLNSIRPLNVSRSDAERILQSGLHLELMTNDKKIIKGFSNRIYSLYLVIKLENRLLNAAKANAERLIMYIKKKYSL
jgi:hypothetical protein